jgi:hypothetical protein
MRLPRVRLFLVATACVVLSALSAAPALGQPVLDTSGRTFTVNGIPRFLLFVSYFDAMRRSDSNGQNTGDLDTDFAYIKAQGFDGIRIFPNWFHYLTGAQADDDGLFKSDGQIRETRWPVFLRVLDRAAAHGLIVDVSFTRETVTNLSPANFALQVVDVTERLDGAYPHVLFDLQNEWGLSWKGNTLADLQALVSQVRSADPERLVTVSLSSATPNEDGQLSASLGLDVVAHHDSRVPCCWFTDAYVQAAIEGVRSGLGTNQMPVYLQEPMAIATLCPPNCDGQTATDPLQALLAASAAKRFGAAAWTFHTRSTFDLASTTFLARLQADPGQKFAFDRTRFGAADILVAGQSWSSPNGSYALHYQGDGNLVLRRSSDGYAVWASGTNPGTAGTFELQGDGNMCLRVNGIEYWTSNTWGNGAATLVVQDDGRLMLYSASGSAVWSSAAGGTGRLDGTSLLFPVVSSSANLTSNDGRFKLTFQSDGNLVLRNEFGQITSQTGIVMTNPGKTVLQADGNFVVSDASGTVYWSSGTWGFPGAYLVLENDGRLRLYSSGGTVIREWGGSPIMQPGSSGDPFVYNASSGSWAHQVSQPGGGFSEYSQGTWAPGWSVLRANFNADALTDVFLYNASGVWYKLLNNGSSFTEESNGAWWPGWQKFVLDLSGDGISDLFLYDPETGQWYRCVSTTTGFTYTTEWWVPGWEITPTNFNGDAFGDLFLINRTTGHWYWVLGATGGFSYPLDGYWVPDWALYPGDFNGDGLGDLFLYRASAGQYYVALSNGTGYSYTAGSGWADGWTPYVGDLDADGDDDLFLHSAITGHWIEMLSDGEGGFSVGGNEIWSTGWQLHPTDLNGDKRTDFVLYNPTTGAWNQARNLAIGLFSYTSGFWAPGLTIVVRAPSQ